MAKLNNTQLNAIEKRLQERFIMYLNKIALSAEKQNTLREETQKEFDAYVLSLPASEILEKDYRGRFDVKSKFNECSYENFRAKFEAAGYKEYIYACNKYFVPSAELPKIEKLVTDSQDILFKVTMLDALDAMKLVDDFTGTLV